MFECSGKGVLLAKLGLPFLMCQLELVHVPVCDFFVCVCVCINFEGIVYYRKVKLYGKSISQCTTITKSRRHGEDSLPGSERRASEHYLASS